MHATVNKMVNQIGVCVERYVKNLESRVMMMMMMIIFTFFPLTKQHVISLYGEVFFLSVFNLLNVGKPPFLIPSLVYNTHIQQWQKDRCFIFIFSRSFFFCMKNFTTTPRTLVYFSAFYAAWCVCVCVFVLIDNTSKYNTLFRLMMTSSSSFLLLLLEKRKKSFGGGDLVVKCCLLIGWLARCIYPNIKRERESLIF